MPVRDAARMLDPIGHDSMLGTLANGSPVTREQLALDDLNNKAGLPTTFAPYYK
jgi:hypothetical protein